MYRICIVDDQEAIRIMLQDFLEERYEVCTAPHADEALALCRKQPFDLVISDINMPGKKGPELLHDIKASYPGTKTVLITAYNIDDYIHLAKTYGISNIIPKTAPFNFTELQSLIDALLSGRIFGLQRYLLDGGRVDETYQVRSSKEARETRDVIIDRFVKKFGSAGEMKLILDEIITNALYHAPSLPDGSQKYEDYDEITLAPDEYIDIACGYDSEKYGVSVVDPKGNLQRDTVLQKIERQVNGKGILDDSGRGIHMSRLFADRMVINIQPAVKTEVILINYFSNKFKGYKPLYINEL